MTIELGLAQSKLATQLKYKKSTLTTNNILFSNEFETKNT